MKPGKKWLTKAGFFQNAHKGQVINMIKSFLNIGVNDIDFGVGVKGFKYMIAKIRITCRRRLT